MLHMLEIQRENWIMLFRQAGGSWSAVIQYVKEHYRPTPMLPRHWAHPQVEILKGYYDEEAQTACLQYRLQPLGIPQKEWDVLFDEDWETTLHNLSQKYRIHTTCARFDVEAAQAIVRYQLQPVLQWEDGFLSMDQKDEDKQ